MGELGSAGTVAHSATPYLARTCGWIHTQVTGHRRWRAIVLTKRRENQDRFAFEPVYSRDDVGPLGRALASFARNHWPGYEPRLVRAARREGARLVHSHFGDRALSDVPMVRELDVPQVASFYGKDAWQQTRTGDWRPLFDGVARVLVEGPAIARRLADVGCPADKVQVHRLGIDLSSVHFRPRTLPGAGEPVRFLVAGRTVEKKGHELAIEALALARRERNDLVLGMILIPGEKDPARDLAAIDRHIQAAGVQGAVEVHTYLPYPEYLAALERYHVFLAPSRHAKDGDAEGGFPVTVTEVLGSGMPVIASDHCDLPSVVDPSQGGVLFPEGDVRALADSMLAMAAEGPSWTERAAAGRRRIEEGWNAKRQAEALERHYDEVVAAHRGRTARTAGS